MAQLFHPSSFEVVTGLANGTALQIAPVVTTAITSMNNYAAAIAVSDPSLASTLLVTATALTLQSSKILGSLPSYFNQIVSHVSTASDIVASTGTMANIGFGDLGSGITNIATMSDQGLSNVLGNLTVAAEVMQHAGKVYDVTDLASFGTPGGLVNSLIVNRLANYSGLNAQLAINQVDMTQLTAPAFAPQIVNALLVIRDITILNTVADHYGIDRSKVTNSLADLLKISIYSAASSQLLGGFATLSTKLRDLGATFANANVAANMLTSLSVPHVPLMTTANVTLQSMSDSFKITAGAALGTGSSVHGYPLLTDFMSTVIGNSLIANIADTSAPTLTMANSLTTQINYVYDLFLKAGITFDVPAGPVPSPGTVRTDFISSTNQRVFTGVGPYTIGSRQLSVYIGGVRQSEYAYTETSTTSFTLSVGIQAGITVLAEIEGYIPPSSTTQLASMLTFANELGTYGANADASTVLTQVCNPTTKGGQAVLLRLAEGKNHAALAACNISPLQF